MKTCFVVFMLLALPAAGMAAEDGRGLLFTTRFDEQSNQSSVPYDALNYVHDEEVQYVVPEDTINPLFDYTSKQWATNLGYNFLVGDYDGDGDYYNRSIFGAVDALLHPRKGNGARIYPITMRQLFFSPREEVASVIAAAPPFVSTLRPADVGRIVPGGLFEIFLSEDQVRDAFRISPNEKFNIDAIMLHKTDQWSPQYQGIYLSFEDAVTITISGGTYTVNDGAVLRIPGNGIAWTVSTYDSVSLLAGSVTPGTGQIILTESDVNAVVATSGVKNNSGSPVSSIGDLDGLTLPKVSGYFTSQHVTGPVHHFWFCGYNTAGGGAILSTEYGGSIPTLNGVPMANNDPGTAASTGEQVGLVTPGGVGSLNGLAITGDDLSHFVLDSTTPQPSGPGVINVQIGGAPAYPGNVFFGWEIGIGTAGGVDVGGPPPGIFAIHPGTFPEFFRPHSMKLPFLVPVAVDSDNCAEWTIDVTPFYPLVVGRNLRFQAAFPSKPDIWLSAPCKIQL